MGAQLLVGLHNYFWTTVERGRVIPHVTGQWSVVAGVAPGPLRIVQGTTVPWERELESHDYASPFAQENLWAPYLRFQNRAISWLGQPWTGLRAILRWGRRQMQEGEFDRSDGVVPDSLAAGVRSFSTNRGP